MKVLKLLATGFALVMWPLSPGSVSGSGMHSALLAKQSESVGTDESTNHNYGPHLEVEEAEPACSLEPSPSLGKCYVGFKEAIAFRESSGSYSIVNEWGYIGKYQFGHAALADLGIADLEHFRKTAALQEKAFEIYLGLNKYRLRNVMDEYTGKTVKGIVITESGMLAAAHLLGPGAVIAYLRNPQEVPKDRLGTTIEDYLQYFEGYDLDNVKVLKYCKLSS